MLSDLYSVLCKYGQKLDDRINQIIGQLHASQLYECNSQSVNKDNWTRSDNSRQDNQQHIYDFLPTVTVCEALKQTATGAAYMRF